MTDLTGYPRLSDLGNTALLELGWSMLLEIMKLNL